MHSQLESLFDEAESRYLKTEELNLLDQYVGSIPVRVEVYRRLRDQELAIMQQVADQLQVELPQEKTENLERSIKNALLALRYCAMAMLLNDDSFVQDRLLGWLSQTVQAYNMQSIDTVLYRSLNHRLSQILTPQQFNLISPHLTLVQNALTQSTSLTPSL